MQPKFTNPQKNSPNVLQKLEADLIIKLPGEYREFLIDNNGGTPEITCSFERKLDKDLQSIAIENFLSIEEIYEAHENLKDWSLYKGLLAIAQSLGAPTICIGIEKDNFGKIIVLDVDFGATVQCVSFNEFLSQLKPSPGK